MIGNKNENKLLRCYINEDQVPWRLRSCLNSLVA